MSTTNSLLSRFFILFLSCISLVACDKSSKTPPSITPVVKPREPVIALALGGGGAKGFAHIGAIKVLESHGIKAKIVTGTSAGSFVGSLYASGKTPFQLQELALKLEEADIRDLTLSKQGFITGQKLQDYVNRNINNKPIQQFPIRFAAIATQLDTGKKVAFNQGNAGQAVRASCSIPNVFIPATIAGKKYVDGGLVSPIPVQTARDMGADIIIAIDISARPKAGQSTNLWGLLDQTLNIMGQQSINHELAQADVVIKPEVGNLGVMDLKSRHQSILEGERAAQAQLATIDRKIQQFKQSSRAKLPATPGKL
ncbi:patatin-like phospholipase family protein [Alkanindiges sp. WGS2144]|uniref:patatin-like phospholipase family protein n=1 Tax=Alkanindiges sp. WGS2144 TaxID=3366808 RepID=UPI003752695C